MVAQDVDVFSLMMAGLLLKDVEVPLKALQPLKQLVFSIKISNMILLMRCVSKVPLDLSGILRRIMCPPGEIHPREETRCLESHFACTMIKDSYLVICYINMKQIQEILYFVQDVLFD